MGDELGDSWKDGDHVNGLAFVIVFLCRSGNVILCY